MAPDDELVKPNVQFAGPPAAVDDGVTVSPWTDWAGVMVSGTVVVTVSDVVDTAMLVVPVVAGLVPARRRTDTTSPARTVLVGIRQETVVPLGIEHCWTLRVCDVVTSVTTPKANEPAKVVPAGSVILMALPAVPSRPPVDEVVKANDHVVRASAAVETSPRVNPVTDCAVVIETGTVAMAVSDVVETETVPGPVAAGLVAPKTESDNWSPAFTVWPPATLHERALPPASVHEVVRKLSLVVSNMLA